MLEKLAVRSIADRLVQAAFAEVCDASAAGGYWAGRGQSRDGALTQGLVPSIRGAAPRLPTALAFGQTHAFIFFDFSERDREPRSLERVSMLGLC